MGPYTYLVLRIDGEYAVLQRIDIQQEDTLLVARALLPEDTGEGDKLLWENLTYTLLP